MFLFGNPTCFQNRLQKYNEWKTALGKLRKINPDAKLPMPVCDKEEVLNPPRTCNISDASLIAWVFRYFNLYLNNKQKFRQLPPGEQHRGMIDYEYQLVHALIGKYALDPKGLAEHITRKKPELLSAWNNLNSKVSKKKEELAKQLPPKSSKNNRPANLSMLAESAVECYIEYISGKLKYWEENAAKDPAVLRTACRKFGVRTGMPKDRASLLKTVLHIDLASYLNAFDYKSGQKYENRSLEDQGHIATQIPFPSDFAQRVMRDTKKLEMQEFISVKEDKNFFDFLGAYRKWETEIAARNFYDTTPLIKGNIALKEGDSLSGIEGLRTSFDDGEIPADLSRSGVKKAIQNIKEVRNQDKLLLKIAFAYWNRFQAAGTFTCNKAASQNFVETPSIYEYFDTSVLFRFPDKGDERVIKLMPNDVNRPVLSQIAANASIIASVMDPEGTKKEFEFYDMLKEYRRIQSSDRTKRLEVIPYINIFANAVNIPLEKYVKDDSAANRNMEYSYYKTKFPALTMEEYNTIVNLRNLVYHRGLNIDLGNVLQILKKYVQLPKREEKKKSFHKPYTSPRPGGNYKPFKPKR